MKNGLGGLDVLLVVVARDDGRPLLPLLVLALLIQDGDAAVLVRVQYSEGIKLKDSFNNGSQWEK